MMSIDPFILEQGVGKVPYSNDAVLSPNFAKKPITIQYDFPGAMQYGRIGQASELAKIAKNTVYFRLEASPYKYRPMVMVPIVSVLGTTVTVATADIMKLCTWDRENVSIVVATTEFVRIWDDSAEEFMDGANDEDRYIADVSYNYGQTNSTITLSGNLTTAVEDGADYIGIGSGLENFQNYVIVDEELNLREDNKPKRIMQDVHTSALYQCRVDVSKLENWNDWPTSLHERIRLLCGRIFWDFS
jgi:hypothetical protein